jgi:predicted dienelactone hydrolase
MVSLPAMRIGLAALLTSLLAVAGAQAQDACLTGASTLADQRALAALTETTEAACPCAAAVSRRAWQRCAKGRLNAALASNTVRRECEKTAKRGIHGTSCGGRKAPCGSVRVDTDRPPKCHLAKTCRDTRRAHRTACRAETACSDVITWTAGTCFDPRDAGAYAAGVRVISWTKDSAVSPGTPRTLDTVIWYPAPAGSGPVAPGYGAVLDAPLDPNGGPYPVVLFSHGSCGYPNQSTFLTPLLASRGYVVVAPPHPGNTIYELPACGSPDALAQAFVERPRDMIFVLDQILAAGQDPASPFFGAIDGSRVAMTGHSFGGLTTFLVSELDPRVKVAVAMAPATPAGGSFSMPSLIALGNADTVVNNPAARQAFAASAPPKLLVEVEHSGHYTFSDGCFPGPDCNPPTTLTQAEAHAAALRYIVPFLDRYLGDHQTVAPLLAAPTGPGFVYQADL